MITFALLRYGLFALFMLFNGLIGTLAALNLGVSTNATGTGSAMAVDIYFISLSILAVLFIFPLLGIEISNKGAFTTRVWFELLWVAVLASLQLGGAVAGSFHIPAAFCQARIAPIFECNASIALLVFIWISVVLHLGYFALLFSLSLLSKEPTIFTKVVCDHPWFGTPAGAQTQNNFGGLPTLKKYEDSFRSFESASSLKEKGYDYYQHNKQSSYDALDAFQVRGPQPLNQSDMDRLARVEQYRMEHHPYQTAAAIQVTMPSAPVRASKKATPTYYDWNSSPFKRGPFGDEHAVETPGYSPAVIQTVQKAAIHQPRVAPARTSPQQPTATPQSLYPQHVTSTGLTTKPVPNAASPPPINVGGRQRRSTGPIVAPLSTVGSSARAPGAVSAWERGHAQGLSIDSINRAPKHRPPPLDLSALSNMNTRRR